MNDCSRSEGMVVKWWHFRAWSFGSGVIGASCPRTEPGACSLLAPDRMTCGWN